MTDGIAGRLEHWRAVAGSGTFEEASAALDEIVAWLESGQRGLDDSVAAYEAGTRLAQRGQRLLAAAELRISQLAVDLDDLDAEVRLDLDAASAAEDDPDGAPADMGEPPF